ncbi:MAG: hypothetical protein MI802_28060 [Desulfobacterales bacterium]|nr:hypothetical protein [Desulfobacterales bacterium]
MAVKLNHYWSVIPEKDKEFMKFMLSKFIPGVNNLGMHTVAVWSVLIGGYSEIILETACGDLEILEKGLNDKKYKSLKQILGSFIYDYNTKVLSNTGRVDSYTMDVRQDTMKFNQMWDIRRGKKKEYDDFIVNEYFPLMEEVGIQVAGEWEVLIGDGPGFICEGRVTDYDNLIRNLQSKKFFDAKQLLRQYATNYRSRILTFSIQKLKGYKSESYQNVYR